MRWSDIARTERIARAFPTHWLRGYARGKLWTDPVYTASQGRLGTSTLPLLDVGCGIGLHAFFLREQGYRGAILGLDSDAPKVADGRLAVTRGGYGEIELQVGDGATLPGFRGHVAMLDVLQYIPEPAQPDLLAGLAARTAPGAWCILRTTPRDGSWRFRLTERAEEFSHQRGWMAQAAIAFPTLDAIRAYFPEAYFEHDVRPFWGWTPFNSWLLAFRRKN